MNAGYTLILRYFTISSALAVGLLTVGTFGCSHQKPKATLPAWTIEVKVNPRDSQKYKNLSKPQQPSRISKGNFLIHQNSLRCSFQRGNPNSFSPRPTVIAF